MCHIVHTSPNPARDKLTTDAIAKINQARPAKVRQ